MRWIRFRETFTRALSMRAEVKVALARVIGLISAFFASRPRAFRFAAIVAGGADWGRYLFGLILRLIALRCGFCIVLECWESEGVGFLGFVFGRGFE